MNGNDARETLADAFGNDLDPLVRYEETFEHADADPFEPFLDDVLPGKNLSRASVRDYHRAVKQWRSHMEREGRHPACPSEDHVLAFVEHELDTKGNAPITAKEKLRKLDVIYRYWQDDPAFPHDHDYDPFELVKSTVDLSDPRKKEPPRVPIPELRRVLRSVVDVRDHAIITLQLKLGLRASEVCNLRIDEVTLEHGDVERCYPSLGAHDILSEYEPAIYIPHDREKNKSHRPRVLPLDDEMRAVLTEYLLIRPDNGEPWLFLSKNQKEQLLAADINDAWKGAFHPEYAETDRYRAVTSHFGRHRFTTYWRVERDLNRELLKYMRGDTPGSATIEDYGAIDSYIHTYYEDICDVYLEDIYQLGMDVIEPSTEGYIHLRQ